jgi:N-methylhydantoinase A
MIPLDDASVRGFDANVRDNLAETFHKRHEQEFTFEARDAEIQLTSLRCEVSVEHKSWPAQFGLPLFSDQEPNMVAGSAEVLLSDRGAQVRTRVTTMDRAGLARGARLDGPAIITDVGSTILVPHGFSASVDNAMNLVLQEADR